MSQRPSLRLMGKEDNLGAQAVAKIKARSQGVKSPKDNWLGSVGDVMKFSGEVTFKSSLRIDGNFSGQVNSESGTLTIGFGAKISQAVINVAVAKINGTV